MLLQGVDVWLNTPTRPLEASGTSGEKAAMNGTVHFSVLDGWWVEGYKEGVGWALPMERSYEVQDFQDELDAESIYNIFEEEIIPLYYTRNDRGVSEQWVRYVKNTVAQVAPHFTTARMIRDYQQRYYIPQAERVEKLTAENYRIARELSSWKDKISKVWEQIEVKEIQLADGITNVLRSERIIRKGVLDLQGLSPEDIGLEIIVTEPEANESRRLIDRFEFTAGPVDGTLCTYLLNLRLMNPGAYDYGIRLFPRNPNLPHRQDFCYLRWI